MAMLLDWLRVWIEGLIRSLGYLGIALVMLAENVFPPIPSELVMPFAGFLAARGELTLWGVLAAGTAGSVAGALVLYAAGQWAGERVLRTLIERWGRWLLVSTADLDRALAVFERYGLPAVFFARLMPIVRSLISIPAGMRRMAPRPFVALTLAGTLLWNGLMTGVGFVLGARWEEFLVFTKQYERGVLLVLGAVVVAFGLLRLAARWRAHRPAQEGDA